MKRGFISFISLVSFAGIVNAQTIKVNKESHDFGLVVEGEQASQTFEVTNTGSAPLVITSVQPSCGCTTPDWTKEPILPGKTGVIKASYNSQGRPGVFNKSITVVSNSTIEGTKVLTIKGFVEKKDETVYTDAQKKASPKLSIDKVAHSFGKIERGTKVSYKFKVTNNGMSDLKITSLVAGCQCVTYTLSKESIKPKETAILEVVYTPNTIGEITDIITIVSNDINNKHQKFSLSAKVLANLGNQNLLKEGNQKVGF